MKVELVIAGGPVDLLGQGQQLARGVEAHDEAAELQVVPAAQASLCDPCLCAGEFGKNAKRPRGEQLDALCGPDLNQ